LTLWAGEKLIGFTLGETLSASQAVIHVEKTDPAYDGAPQMIFSTFCERYWKDCPEINVGDDWGIPGLRFTKQSYRPTRMISKHALTRAPIAQVAGMDIPARNPPHAFAAGRMVEPIAMLRAARLEDAAAIDSLERSCFAREKEIFSPRQIKGLLTNPNARVSVAEVDGEVAGWAVGLIRVNRHPRSGMRYKLGRLYAVAVDPAQRGKGIGRTLVEATLGSLEGAGAERIYLEVRETNLAAIGLYESLGFATLKKLADYYGPGVNGRRMVRMRPLVANEAMSS
jgi:ribosomal protein S18 acetylase RimI-like enzyme